VIWKVLSRNLSGETEGSHGNFSQNFRLPRRLERANVEKDDNHHSHRRGNLKSYECRESYRYNDGLGVYMTCV
jgi:hypothetical protein